ncbi:MAG: TIGR02147 family protein [Deltaproteobacteria bacterium]|nr:MAG: TIGR02147 family protein [Deltaproteobacteria bacterium]
MQQPNLENYLDYREYLCDFFEFKKNQRADYSHRMFMHKAGLKSPSHLKSVMSGERNLTNKSLPKYIKAIGFDKKREIKLFELLVSYNQCKDAQEKVDIFREILGLKSKRGLTSMEESQFRFLSEWHYVAIYVLIDLVDFKADPEWIAAKLRKKVSPKQIESAIEGLESLGLIKKDSKRGYVQTGGALSSPDEVRHTAIHEYHKTMLNLASQSLIEDDLSTREFNGVTLPIPKDKLPALKEKIRQFRKEINQLASNLENPDEVYQLNIQLFPLTEDRH